jgi:hypothetical protein
MQRLRALALALCTLALVSPVQSQASDSEKIDTVYVTAGSNTVLAFPDQVNLVVLGSKQFADGRKQNTVVLQATVQYADPTSIHVKYGDKFWSGTLAFLESDDPRMARWRLVDLSYLENKALNVVDNIAPQDDAPAYDVETVDPKIAKMILEKDQHAFYGEKKNNIFFSVSDIRNDEEYYYFKISILNSSKVDYAIKDVGFRFLDRIETNSGGKTLSPSIMEVIANNGIQVIPGKSKAKLIYVIQKYNVSEDTILEINILESEGGRNFTATIKSKDILKSNPFKEIKKS